MAKRGYLTDRFIQSRKPAPAGKRILHRDRLVTGLALRVTDRGHKSFVLVTRYPGSVHPAPRALGDYGEITLEQARSKARAWIELVQKGIDPRVEEARALAAAARQRENSFAKVAAEFLDRHAKRLRKYDEAKRVIETEFVKRWGPRSITEIEPSEVAVAIRAIVARGAPYQAHNALGYIRRLYSWAIGTHEFGVLSSPVALLKPGDLIGAREARERKLEDFELREVWIASAKLGYPYGAVFRLLIITGQRKSEVAEAQWPEFDPHIVELIRERKEGERIDWSEVDVKHRLWTIPAHRMKGGRTHEVPLTDSALSLMETLPRFTKGEFLFTTTSGEKPVNGFSKAKERLDKLIATSRIKRGVQSEDGAGAMPAWVIHDLRRTVRTHFSALPVEDVVRELVIAHTKKGLHKVYDQHAYRDEKRQCLELWDARLQRIIRDRGEQAAHARQSELAA